MFYQSGYPMGIVDGRYVNNLRGGTPRPNVTTNDWRAATAGERFDPSVDNFYNAAVFQGLERDRAGVQQRGKAADRGRHVRDDAEGAAEGGKDAGPPAFAEAIGERVEHARAGQEDDDQRGQQIFGGHMQFSQFQTRTTEQQIDRLAVLNEIAENTPAHNVA